MQSTKTVRRIQSLQLFKLMALASCVGLSACGGGGGDSGGGGGGQAAAEGAYQGTLTGGSSTNFSAIVLDDGQIWATYGRLIGGVLYVSGVIQGHGSSSGGQFSSSDVKDFGYYPAVSAALTSSYVAGQSITGTITEAGGSITFSGTTIPTATYNYNTPASISAVAGAWTLNSTSGNTLAINIAGDGSVTGSDQIGCSLSGSLTPRAGGKNVFDVRLTFGPAPCALPGQVASGIALTSTPQGAGSQLTVGVIDSSRTVGTVAFGSR